MRINFYGPPATFPRIPFWRAVKDELAPGEVRGRIVLIGSTAPSLHDSYQTPHTEKLVLTLTGQAERITKLRGVGGHGGGDEGLMRAFVGALRGDRAGMRTSAREAVASHLMAFAAEAARVSGDAVDMERYRRSVS